MRTLSLSADGCSKLRGLSPASTANVEAEIYRIPIHGTGSLSITARPRGGDWLDDDIAALGRQGVSVLVSLLCEEEQAELALEHEARACFRHDIEFVSLPVPDLGTPPDSRQFVAAVHRLAQLVRDGGHIAVHCRQSVGRSGLLAVSIAVALGTSLESSLDFVSHARGVRVPETSAQQDWLQRNFMELSGLAG